MRNRFGRSGTRAGARLQRRRITAPILAAVALAAGATAASPAVGSAQARSGRGHTRTGVTVGGQRSWLPQTPEYWPLVVGAQHAARQEITRGVAHSTEALQTVGGRQQAQILKVNLGDPNLHAGIVEAGDHLIDPADETVSSMADRSGAVAGINGDFFAINGDGDPTGMLIENGRLIKSPNPQGNHADFGIEPDGKMVITSETFSGTIADGSSSHALASVNTVDPLLANGITRVTPDLGPVTIPAATVVAGHLAPDGSSVVVDSVKTGVTSLPQLATGNEDLVGVGTGGTWLSSTIHAGDTIKTSESVAPYGDLQTAVSGGAILVQNGKMAVPVTGGGENNINDPVTGLGITADGKHAIIAVFDGHQSENSAEGLTRPQLAQWMIAHGAVNAIEFDSGGSSEMVGRLPGQSLSVLNTPSDGHERPVANGLFFYTNETTPGAATKAVVDDGKTLAVLAGSTVPVSAYATDALGNPASRQPAVSVSPSRLASVSGGKLSAGTVRGSGRLIAVAGRARSSVRLRVLGHLRSLSISPSEPNLLNGATQQFSDSASAGHGAAVTLDPADVHWSVSPSDLGSVSSTGLFTAASSGAGLATVTATAGGATASTTVAVGQTPKLIDPMTDVSDWTVSGTEGATASLSESTTEVAQPGDSGSMDVHYSIPAGSGDKQVVFSPKVNESFPAAGSSQDPTAIGIWVKGQGISGSPSAPLSDGNLTLAESYAQINGQAVTFYPTTVTYSGWRLIVAPVPTGTLFPLQVSFLDFLVISPTAPMSGDLYVSDLEALYPPRPPATAKYVPVPHNPPWLHDSENPLAFRTGGTTLAAIGGAKLNATDPGTSGAVAMRDLRETLAGLPSGAAPDEVQALGDMSATGSTADLAAAKSALAALGTGSQAAVGPDETSAGADPENGNFAAAFGATHYAYRLGSADVIVGDDSQGGLLASDPFQSPADEQYAWLVDQLDADASPVTFVAMSVPASDPNGDPADEFSDGYEAQEYEALLQRFQRTHRSTHVIALSGQGSGYGDTIAPGEVPNLSIGDVGTAPTAAADAGGFDDYGLFHVDPDGSVHYAVQPLLTSIAVTAPKATLRPGTGERLTAVGTQPAGDDLATAPKVPIADPAAHLWTSSNRSVATVDARTGRLSARAPGTTTVSVRSDDVTGSAQVTVSRR